MCASMRNPTDDSDLYIYIVHLYNYNNTEIQRGLPYIFPPFIAVKTKSNRLCIGVIYLISRGRRFARVYIYGLKANDLRCVFLFTDSSDRQINYLVHQLILAS